MFKDHWKKTVILHPSHIVIRVTIEQNEILLPEKKIREFIVGYNSRYSWSENSEGD